MKTNNKTMAFAISGLLAMGFASCTDGNDWSVDSAFDRLFSVSDDKISVTAEDVLAHVTFNASKDAEYYIIEVSTDSLHDGIAMGGANAIVFGAQDKSITKSPADITGLAGDTKYFLRIKSMADGRNESKWSYYNDGQSFKTKAEQIFYPVSDADRFEDYIHLTWNAAMDVTNITVSVGDTEVQNIVLDADAKSKGEINVTGLTPSTTYTFVIYNGTAKRGTLTVSTTAAMPSGEYKVQLPASIAALDQATIDDVVAKAQATLGKSNVSVTIGIPAGLTLDACGLNEEGEATGLYIPDGVSITFFGLSGGNAPVLNFKKSFDLKGSHNYIRFENISFTDGGCQYFINQSAAVTISEDLSFKQCRFDSFDRSFIRTQGSVDIVVANLVIDDCVMTNMSSGNGYSVIYFGTAKTKIGSLTLTNSTFDTTQRSFVEASKAPITNGITITNCTFYNNVVDGRYLIDANGQATDITVKNTILGKSKAETARGIRTKGSQTFDNCLRAADCVYSANDISLEADEKTSADIFVDPDNHDFTLKITKLIGDPRWYPED
ncbi:MAG: DUF5123 domain-containing protein [Prevotellaceae bacterium]|nr:DUF5123 domain-containing protein [Prevotellaceae bacterium]